MQHTPASATNRPLGLMIAVGYPRANLDQQFELLHTVGATHVELYVNWPERPDLTGIDHQLGRAGLNLWSCHGPYGRETFSSTPLDLGSLDNDQRARSIDETVDALRQFGELGGGRIVLHPGGLSPESALPARNAALKGSMEELLPVAEDARVVMCIENMPKWCYPGSHSEHLLPIIDELNHPNLGLCLDTGHAHIVSSVANEAGVQAHRMLTIHVHDNHGRDTHEIPFDGSIDWDEFPAVLDEVKYSGVVMLECSRKLRRVGPERLLELNTQFKRLCQSTRRLKASEVVTHE